MEAKTGCDSLNMEEFRIARRIAGCLIIFEASDTASDLLPTNMECCPRVILDYFSQGRKEGLVDNDRSIMSRCFRPLIDLLVKLLLTLCCVLYFREHLNLKLKEKKIVNLIWFFKQFRQSDNILRVTSQKKNI